MSIARTSRTGATFSPAMLARRIATNSAFTTLYVSVEEENFAIVLIGPSWINTLGLAPPMDVLCSSTSARPEANGRPRLVP